MTGLNLNSAPRGITIEHLEDILLIINEIFNKEI